MSSSSLTKFPAVQYKRNPKFTLLSPFPIPISSVLGLTEDVEADPHDPHGRETTSRPVIPDKWPCYHGMLIGSSVIVRGRDDKVVLSNMGFFGNDPTKANERKMRREERRANRRKRKAKTGDAHPTKRSRLDATVDDDDEAANLQTDSSSEEEEEDNEDESPSAEQESRMQTETSAEGDDDDIVILDEWSENAPAAADVSEWESTLVIPGGPSAGANDDEDQKDTGALYLTPEEAFFLCYGLGCLVVSNSSGDKMDVVQLWDALKKSVTNFVPRYVVYHYLRSKGWVVKPGIQFGGDFLIYSKGPPFSHASCVCQVIEEYDSRSLNQFTWTTLGAMQRQVAGANKELLLCYVNRRDAAAEEACDTPKCLSGYSVREVLFRRWVAGENREGGTNK